MESVTVYVKKTKTTNPSEDKLIKYLTQNHIPYELKPLIDLNRNDMITFLRNSVDGYESLLSGKAKAQYDDYTFTQLLYNIQKGVVAVRTPLAISGLKTMIGYQELEVGVFVPREMRRAQQFLNAVRAAELGLNYDISGNYEDDGDD